MRHGVVLLTDEPWRESAPRWRAVEELGFDHAWTYDHLVWGGLPDSPWRSAMPTLAAAAGVTERIGLGTFVSSPNQNHPYAYARDVITLEDLTGGRFRCGVGAGGDLDARLLGADLGLRERVDRFHEFVPLLDRLLREDHVEHTGRWYTTRDARTLPGPVRHRVPLLVAANGPRSIALAARYGDAWVTYGGRGETLAEWFAHVAELAERFGEAADAAGRPALDRYLSLDSSPRFSLESAALYAEMSGRAVELGFTDVVCHWPRQDSPYRGDPAVLEEVAGTLRSGT
ncbi:LLM class flavin-dependent oxidoreductase [Phycicoccus endophyticus]|uniref:LLM class flavin-dependent oxidoreductase n=1 Tax=Phycicoccus endophyticus TaxID=1690220 RepID=A0A7G9R632_9MICO|nr:LLM class flavin-dependent oxidoreductase [Phycicoccus endophyticus]NHI20221.1 LLM class flavin-dependent oxidoreductase [Phycicoccus endophyticus]QNN51057.1 LLM class flavin-dependent oxidoreductase [Phycicoccus endophyticus]